MSSILNSRNNYIISTIMINNKSTSSVIIAINSNIHRNILNTINSSSNHYTTTNKMDITNNSNLNHRNRFTSHINANRIINPTSTIKPVIFNIINISTIITNT